MFVHIPPKERVIYVVLASILLFGAGYSGAKYLRKPPQIVIEELHDSGPNLRLGDQITYPNTPFGVSKSNESGEHFKSGTSPQHSVAILSSTPSESTVHGKNKRSKGKHPKEPIDVNTASLDKLQELPGIGPAMAQRIEQYRAEHGPFHSIDDLRAVRGIGDKKLEAIRPFIRPIEAPKVP